MDGSSSSECEYQTPGAGSSRSVSSGELGTLLNSVKLKHGFGSNSDDDSTVDSSEIVARILALGEDESGSPAATGRRTTSPKAGGPLLNNENAISLLDSEDDDWAISVPRSTTKR